MYPYGALLSHVLGYVDVDNQGIAGLERSFNGILQDVGADSGVVELSIDVRAQEGYACGTFCGDGNVSS